MADAAAAALGLFLTAVIGNDLRHESIADPVEMSDVIPPDGRLFHQPDAEFADEVGGFDALPAAQLATSHAFEVGDDEIHRLIAGGTIASLPVIEQPDGLFGRITGDFTGGPGLVIQSDIPLFARTRHLVHLDVPRYVRICLFIG